MNFLGYLKTTLKKNRGLSDLTIFEHRKIYTDWKYLCESKKTPLELELPWITIISKKYLDDYFKNKLKPDVNVFEFGSGGSSLFFLRYSNNVVSIEHDKEWFGLVDRTIKQKKITGWSGQLIEPELINNSSQIKLDASDPLHYYTTDENYLNCTFKNYASYIDNFPESYFDVILVDGRSRPACLYHSINKVKKGGLLILDNAEREYYLSKEIIDINDFKLILSINSAIICFDAFSQTNIYFKK